MVVVLSSDRNNNEAGLDVAAERLVETLKHREIKVSRRKLIWPYED